MEQPQYLTIKKIEREHLTIHCVQSPIEGELVNAQIIETDNSLVLIDTLQLVPYANELREYITSLGKPLKKIIITHVHPDHWFGAASFKEYPIYALPEVIEKINYLADYLLNFHRSLHGDQASALIPAEKVTPSEILEEGVLEIDGLKLNLIRILKTESPSNLLVEIPDYKILLAQDLIYNKAYSYFGEVEDDGIDLWIAELRRIGEKNYTTIVPGHGDPTDGSIVPVMIEYLTFVKGLLLQGLTDDALINAIKSQYPDYQLPLTLTMSNYMMNSWKQAQVH